MGADTKIQWCHYTFNPVRGCVEVSEGCDHCYARAMSLRNPSLLGVWGKYGTRIVASDSMWQEPMKWNEEAGLAGGRRRVFCASLADIFEDFTHMLHYPQKDEETGKPGIVCAWWTTKHGICKAGKTSASYSSTDRHATMQDVRNQVFKLIEETRNLDWLLLTKRPENVMRMVPESWQHRFPDNVWMGTTTENQQRANERVPILVQVPARVRFLSCEPLLGPVTLFDVDGEISVQMSRDNPRVIGYPADYIQWVIVGGESGPGARHCHNQGYLRVGNHSKCAGEVYLHRRIWTAAHGAIPKGMEVLMLDGNKRNVALENLALGRPGEATRKASSRFYLEKSRALTQAVLKINQKASTAPAGVLKSIKRRKAA